MSTYTLSLLLIYQIEDLIKLIRFLFDYRSRVIGLSSRDKNCYFPRNYFICETR